MEDILTLLKDLDCSELEQIRDEINKMIDEGKHSVLYRAKDHFPIGGYVTLDDCKANWLDDDTLEFSTCGWHSSVLEYKVKNGLYNKIRYYRGNVNGRGGTLDETYDDSPWIDEEDMFLELKELLKD